MASQWVWGVAIEGCRNGVVCRNGAGRQAGHCSAAGPVWKTNVPCITHEFLYKVLWKKLRVRQCVGLMKDIQHGCAWSGEQETVYHIVKSCPMV